MSEGLDKLRLLTNSSDQSTTSATYDETARLANRFPAPPQSASNQPQEDELVTIAKKYGVNPQLMLNIRDKGERSKSHQVSPAGAMGRMQLMPAIADKYGINNPFNDSENYDGAVRLVRDNIQRMKAQYPDKSDKEIEQLVIANYNGGEAASNAVAAGRQPPAQETINYMRRVGGSSQSGLDQLRALVEADNNQPAQASYDETARLANRFPAPAKPIDESSSDAEYASSLSKLKPQSGRSAMKTAMAAAELPEQRVQGAVATDAAVRGITAGFDFGQPRFATEEQIASHPKSALLGSMVGTAPYIAATGGASLPVQMGVLGARGGLQAYNESGDTNQALTAGAIEGISPVVAKVGGALVTKGLEKVNPTFNSIFRPGYNEMARQIDSKVAELNTINANIKDITTKLENATSLAERKELTKQYGPVLKTLIGDQQKASGELQQMKGFGSKLASVVNATESPPFDITDYLSKQLTSPLTGLSGLIGGGIGYTNSEPGQEWSDAVKWATGGAGLKVLAAKAATEYVKRSPQFLSAVINRLPVSNENIADYLSGAGKIAQDELKKSGAWYKMSQTERDAAVKDALKAATDVYSYAYKIPAVGKAKPTANLMGNASANETSGFLVGANEIPLNSPIKDKLEQSLLLGTSANTNRKKESQ